MAASGEAYPKTAGNELETFEKRDEVFFKLLLF